MGDLYNLNLNRYRYRIFIRIARVNDHFIGCFKTGGYAPGYNRQRLKH